MKKLALCIALAFVLVMGASSPSLAGIGVGIDKVQFCNDIWVDVADLGTGVYEVTGTEAGTCPNVAATFTGTCRLVGGVAYFGLVGSYPLDTWNDMGAVKNENFAIPFGGAGIGYYMYVYSSSGVVTIFGGGPYDYTMTYPVPPPAGAEGEAFEPNDGPAE